MGNTIHRGQVCGDLPVDLTLVHIHTPVLYFLKVSFLRSDDFTIKHFTRKSKYKQIPAHISHSLGKSAPCPPDFGLGKYSDYVWLNWTVRRMDSSVFLPYIFIQQCFCFVYVNIQ